MLIVLIVLCALCLRGEGEGEGLVVGRRTGRKKVAIPIVIATTVFQKVYIITLHANGDAASVSTSYESRIKSKVVKLKFLNNS